MVRAPESAGHVSHCRSLATPQCGSQIQLGRGTSALRVSKIALISMGRSRRSCITHQNVSMGRSRSSCMSRQNVKLACWNMRSLVESDGSIDTATVRKDGRLEKGAVEKKATMMVWELKQYGVYAAGISELKWFGTEFSPGILKRIGLILLRN